MKFTKNIIAFAGERVSTYEKFADYFKHYRSETEGVQGLQYDHTISFDEKDKKMNEALLKEIETFVGRTKPEGVSLAVWANDPQVRHYTFAVVGAMIDAIIPETLINSIGLYADIRYAGYGDSFAFNVESSDLFAVSQAGNGKRLGFVQKDFKGTRTILPVNHKITVEVSLYRVLSGLESLARFTMKAIRSIETQLTYDAYDAMAAGLNSLSGAAAGLHLASYTQDGLISLCQKITAWNGGRKAIIVGTTLALNKILPSNANYRYMLDSEFVKLGYVKEFGGFATMVLPQVADYSSTTYGLKLADNKIFVISPSADKLIKVGIEGDTLTYVDEIDDNANLTQNATINKRWGTAMITSAKAGVIDIV